MGEKSNVGNEKPVIDGKMGTNTKNPYSQKSNKGEE